MTVAVQDRLHDVAPIDLAELIEKAELQTRVDRKYLLPLEHVSRLVERLPHDAQVLDIAGTRLFDYESVYFDTPDLMSYRLAATARRRKFKIRTRSYLDSAQCFLEVKTQGARGSTVKNRIPYSLHDRLTVDPGRAFVTEILAASAVAAPERLVLRPTLATRYLRATLYLAATASRVTIDTGLTWNDGAGRLDLRGLAVVETKTGSTPSRVDRLLWQMGHRPLRVSKYATGLAALHPELPATRWRRTLHHHLLPNAGSGPAARH